MPCIGQTKEKPRSRVTFVNGGSPKTKARQSMNGEQTEKTARVQYVTYF